MTTHGELRPTYTERGSLLLDRSVVAYRCPACRGHWLAPARHAASWACNCGASVEITVDAAEWKRIEAEHKANPPDVTGYAVRPVWKARRAPAAV
jgi:hypothetical protein